MLEHLFAKVNIFRRKGEYKELHGLFKLYVYLLIVWGFYRVLFRFPVEIEELVLKPIVFVLPVLYLVSKEKKAWKARLSSLGILWKNSFSALAFGLSLGVFYLFVGRLGQFFRFGTLASNPYGTPLEQPMLVVILAFATAISEELVFMGYLLPRLQRVWKSEWRSTTVIAILFALIHVPILVFAYRFSGSLVLGQFLLTFVLGFGNGVLMLRLKNLVAPVFSHALWGMAILLFR